MNAQLIWFCGTSNFIRFDFSSDLIGHICLFLFTGSASEQSLTVNFRPAIRYRMQKQVVKQGSTLLHHAPTF
ncbi:MAG: hypothetical protein MZV63_38410 [Marinilabiliales bacterium]|nr:hypothetical protein [Marinilabiliales bacterium]